MSTTIEAQGHTVDEAIQIALNQLGVSRDKVEIDILHHPRRGVLGIGARRAKVRATIREAVMPDGEEFDMSGGADLDDKPRRRRRRGGRGRRGEDGAEQTPRPAARPDERRGEQDRRGPAREGQQRSEGGRATDEGGRARDEGGRARDEGGRARDEGGRARDEGGRTRSEGGRGRDDRRGGRGRDQRPGQGQRGDQQAPQAQPGREQGQQRQGRGQRGEGRGDGQRADGRPEGQRDNQPRGERRDGRDQRDRGQQGRRDRDQNERRERGPRPEQAGVAGASVENTSFELAESAAPEFGAAEFAAAPAPAPAPRRAPAEPEPPLDAEALDAIRARAEVLVRELLEKMGFPAEVSSSIDEAAGEAVVSVRSESEGLLIGRRGQTLDSLEHIVNRMTLRADAYVEGRVLLDIGDYRKRRRESLDELAQRLRTRAVTERRTVQVSPMSPRDRKFFAQVFAGDDAVEVRALGAGFYRRVIVAPAGAGPAAVAEAEVASEVEDDSHEHETFAGGEAES
jgi:predicted RNA-binding protein Jag